jgi:hypothetical protein
MARKIASIVFLLTSIVIGLGAFGHDSNAGRLAEEFAKAPALDAGTVSVVLAVWHFCSGCMFVLGAICVWNWWRMRRGARDAYFAPSLVAVFYVITGAATVAYTGKPFFWLFVVLGGLLLASTWMLRTPK